MEQKEKLQAEKKRKNKHLSRMRGNRENHYILFHEIMGRKEVPRTGSQTRTHSLSKTRKKISSQVKMS